jgi:outer membrane protein OmpA-like peptidoglycan-associated protein
LSGYPYRTLFIWTAILALLWLTLCSPWSPGWNAVAAVLVVFVMILLVVVATRRFRARQKATRHVLSAIDVALDSLPADLKRNMPLVLAIGDGSLGAHRPEGSSTAGTADAPGPLADVFGSHPVLITDATIWVRVDEPARLMHLADALKRWRDGQGPDAIAYLMAVDRIDSEATLSSNLKRWRSAIGETSRALGYPLPVCVAAYAEEAHAAPDECPWFGVSGSEPLQTGTLAALVASRAARYTRTAIPQSRGPRAHRSAHLDALTRWACDAVLPALVEVQRIVQRGSQPLLVTALGLTTIDGRPARGSPYHRFVSSITALNFASGEGTRPRYPLPEPLIRGIPPQPVRRALPRALAHAFVWLAVCFCAAAAASAWQNLALVQRVTGHMAYYRAIPPASDKARVDALNAVKHDRDELERYARSGAPPRLGFGFYRGAPLLPSVNALIASYQPPAPPPSTIELNSLSLFNTGSAVLNPGSNRVLVGALEMIRTHPDKRVLVAGHTDSLGSPASNQKLSEARATSVRDWLADASGIAPSHFAIQGYGDTRPKASNDTEAGRAANRRVEITLVPDCRDVRDDGSTTQAQPACSPE